MERETELPFEIVDLTSSGWNARLGRYFIGQTGELHFGGQFYAWGGIINPYYSETNLYFDIFTITNYGTQSFNAEIWLNAEPVYGDIRFSTITASNQAINPPPRPIAMMQQAEYLGRELSEGVNIFDRIVSPNSTLVSDSHQGSIILGPGGSFSILLKSLGRDIVTSTVVLTWWEEKAERGQRYEYNTHA